MATFDTHAEQYGARDPGVCALVQDLLPLYIEGEVSPQSRDLIVDHLGECAHCAGFLAGAQSIRAQLRRGGTARLHEPNGDMLGLGRFLDMAAVIVGGLALAAVVAISVITGLQLISAPSEWLYLLLSLSEPRWMYALLGLVTLTATAVLLVSRRPFPPALALASGGAALGLGLVGFLIGYPNSLEWLLRALLVAAGAMLLWHQRQGIRTITQLDVARLVGAGCLAAGAVSVVLVLGFSNPLVSVEMSEPAMPMFDPMPTVVPPEPGGPDSIDGIAVPVPARAPDAPTPTPAPFAP